MKCKEHQYQDLLLKESQLNLNKMKYENSKLIEELSLYKEVPQSDSNNGESMYAGKIRQYKVQVQKMRESINLFKENV